MVDAEESTILIVGGEVWVALVHDPRDDDGGILVEICYRWIVHTIERLQLDGTILERISEQEGWTDITVDLPGVVIFLLSPYSLGTDAIIQLAQVVLVFSREGLDVDARRTVVRLIPRQDIANGVIRPFQPVVPSQGQLSLLPLLAIVHLGDE